MLASISGTHIFFFFFLKANASFTSNTAGGGGRRGLDGLDDFGGNDYFYQVAHCLLGPKGHSVVSLAPFPWESRKRRVETGDVQGGAEEGVMVVVDGQDSRGFAGAADLFVDGLFDTNHWQHRQADYVLANHQYGTLGVRAIVAAGYWGNKWEYVAESSYIDC
jgi:hypothetical protein